jgi:hypothetical protein
MRSKGKRTPGEFWSMPLVNKGRLEQLASVPILACVGYNGMGKSAAAAAVARMHLDAGRPVLGTARMLDYNDPRPCELGQTTVITDAGRPAYTGCQSRSHGLPGHLQAHPLWVPLSDYRQLFTFTNGHVWLDEATGVADARSSQSMPGEVSDYLPRLRVQQVTMAWTTIHWSFADVRLRRITWAALWAVGLMPKYVGDEIWGRNRLFYYRVYDAKNLADDFEPAKRDDEVKAMVRSWVWGPRSNAFASYDSHDPVLSLGGTDESGMCMTCGGHRGRKTCKGHGPESEDAAAAPRRRSRRAARTDGPEGAPATEDRPPARTGADVGDALGPAPSGPELLPGAVA